MESWYKQSCSSCSSTCCEVHQDDADQQVLTRQQLIPRNLNSCFLMQKSLLYSKLTSFSAANARDIAAELQRTLRQLRNQRAQQMRARDAARLIDAASRHGRSITLVQCEAPQQLAVTPHKVDPEWPASGVVSAAAA